MGLTVDVALVLVIAAVASAIGVAFGIVLVAPRIQRALDRTEADHEEPGDRPD